VDLHLDELVIFKRVGQGAQDTLRHSGLADGDNRLQVMTLCAQGAALLPSERHVSSSK
jgi:hypothetical protein